MHKVIFVEMKQASTLFVGEVVDVEPVVGLMGLLPHEFVCAVRCEEEQQVISRNEIAQYQSCELLVHICFGHGYKDTKNCVQNMSGLFNVTIEMFTCYVNLVLHQASCFFVQAQSVLDITNMHLPKTNSSPSRGPFATTKNRLFFAVTTSFWDICNLTDNSALAKRSVLYGHTLGNAGNTRFKDSSPGIYKYQEEACQSAGVMAMTAQPQTKVQLCKTRTKMRDCKSTA